MKTRTTVAKLFRTKIGEADEFRVPEVTDAIVAEIQADPDLLASFVKESLRPMVYTIGLAELARWRQQKEGEGIEVVLTGEYGATRETITRKATIRRLQWLSRAEHVGDRHMLLETMEREHLLTAAEERETRAEAEAHVARFLRAVASRLQPGETVGERFKDEQLDEIYRSVSLGPVAATA